MFLRGEYKKPSRLLENYFTTYSVQFRAGVPRFQVNACMDLFRIQIYSMFFIHNAPHI